MWFGLVTLILSIDYKKYTKQEIIINAVLLSIGGIVYLIAKDWTVFKVALILVAIKDRDIDDIIRISLYTCMAILGISIIMSFFDPSKLYIVDNFGRGKIEKRYCFGFTHPNQFNLAITYLIIGYMYLKKRKVDLKELALLLILTIVTYILTTSRTGLLVTLAAIAINIVAENIKIDKDKNNLITKIIQGVYLGMIILQVIMVVFYDKIPIFGKIDDILNNRIMVAYNFYEQYGISLIGQKIHAGTFELGYMNALVKLGIIPVVLLIISQITLIKKYMLNKEYKKVALIVIFTIYSFTENNWLFIFRNLSILLCAELIYNSNFEFVKIFKQKIKQICKTNK